jgi:tetratricopeptide (TPR) repeat protein
MRTCKRLASSVAAAALVAALGLSAGQAAAQSEASRAKIGPSVDTPSLYGAFLAGQEALHEGHGDAAARLLIDAATDRPDDVLLRDHAFAAALIIGDVPAAARLAPAEDDKTLEFRGLGRLTRAVDALADGRGAEADKDLSGPPVGFPNHAVILLMKPFAAAAAGDWDRAVAAHDAEGERLVILADQSTRAQLLELHGRYAEADALFKGLAEDSIASSLFAVPYGEFLERRGRSRDAIALYDKALLQNPGDSALIAARARAQGFSRPPPVPDIRQAAAQALTLAAGTMAGQRQAELSLIYARLALRLDPQDGQAWVMAGDALVVGKDEADARVAWDRVQPASRYYADARCRTAYSLQRSGDMVGAQAAVRELLRSDPRNQQGQLVLADLLHSAGQYAEASQALDRLIDDGGGRDWRVLYMRAATREELGRWPDAQADLQAALKLAPDEPELLNYLGYQWIDRGQDVKGGLALIQRAVHGRPNSGAMQDSLGWAQFRLGDYPKAVEVLEAAVLMEPSDAAINDHLGDAYWMVGRKDEAGFQWRRALGFNPDAGLKARIEAKVKDGLGAKARVAAQ